jgi:uncharacterized Ntn-hydrolase superfamily protein
MTYSIVARDRATGQLGIGLQSHFFSVGSVASFAAPGIGAIATQAFASRQYGPLGLQMLAAGMPSPAVLDALLRLDPNREVRQIGIVDVQGRSAAFTGARCVNYASHQNLDGVSAQGKMIEAYRTTAGDLAERILAALEAAQQAGGDARGVQSASLLVVGATPDGRPWDATLHDERVDDSANPLAELRRLAGLRRGYRKLGAVLFEEGPLFSDVNQTDPAELERALGNLREGAEALGDSNFEASLWQGVLMARHGREREAAEIISPLIRRQAALATFIKGLVACGIIGSSAGADLLRAAENRAP